MVHIFDFGEGDEVIVPMSVFQEFQGQTPK
jgi:hypothetical protein